MKEFEKHAVSGILSEYYLYWLSLQRDKALKAEVDARIATANSRFEDFKGAFKVFGFSGLTDVPMFDAIKDQIGEAAYMAALAEGKRQFEQPGSVGEQPKNVELLAAEMASDAAQTAVPDRPKIRDAVLAMLKEQGDAGDGATSLRKKIQEKYRIELHEKTVGMTLYRLFKEGLVSRNRRTWFFVPPKAETENPGGETPGQLNYLD